MPEKAPHHEKSGNTRWWWHGWLQYRRLLFFNLFRDNNLLVFHAFVAIAASQVTLVGKHHKYFPASFRFASHVDFVWFCIIWNFTSFSM
jgi:hypothetical protein